MRVVELRRRRPEDGSIETLARLYAPDDGGPAVIEPAELGDRDWIETLLSAGAIAADGRVLSPADGEAFVLALPASFRGSRLWAEEVPSDRA